MLYNPKLRRADELTPPDDEEETSKEKERRDAEHADQVYDERNKN